MTRDKMQTPEWQERIIFVYQSLRFHIDPPPTGNVEVYKQDFFTFNNETLRDKKILCITNIPFKDGQKFIKKLQDIPMNGGSIIAVVTPTSFADPDFYYNFNPEYEVISGKVLGWYNFGGKANPVMVSLLIFRKSCRRTFHYPKRILEKNRYFDFVYDVNFEYDCMIEAKGIRAGNLWTNLSGNTFKKSYIIDQNMFHYIKFNRSELNDYEISEIIRIYRKYRWTFPYDSVASTYRLSKIRVQDVLLSIINQIKSYQFENE